MQATDKVIFNTDMPLSHKGSAEAIQVEDCL